MARPTLKITKQPASSTARAPSSRAIRAQLQATRNAPRPLAPAAQPPATVPDPQASVTTDNAATPRPGKRTRVRAKGAATPGATDARASAPAAPTHDSTKRERRPRTERRASASPQTAKPVARPTPPSATPDLPRLSKRMSELGLCSRREADEWIERGWVKVDGEVVATLGTRVSPNARIEIAKAAARQQGEQVTMLLNKPVGYVSGQAEDGYKPASVLLVPANRWADDPSRVVFKPAHLRGLAPAGRLDIDSTGLLVFTQDGRVAKRLIGNDSEVEKEYLVRVEGTLDDAGLARLRHGLQLDGVKLKPAKVSWQNEHQLRFVLREGRKRQIRRMCELVGLTVTGLKRVRTGSVSLGPLPPGQWRYLRPDESF